MLFDERMECLKQVLEAAATAPGNRERFLKANLIETTSSQESAQLVSNWYQAFEKLAPIDKQTIRQHPGLFIANADDVVYRGMTSGSRGQSFIYFAGREWNEARTLARRRSLHWWRIDEHTSIINVASRLMPVRTIDVAIAGPTNSDFIHILLTLLNQRLVALRGYPSRLCEVATKLYGRSLPPVIAVICTGECLFEYQRTLLEAIFQAPVIEEYGCQETGISGLTCPEAGRLHLDSDRCLYEIIDGQLVTTDLFNRIMPLVRYKSGDLIKLNSQPCPCGRPGLTGNLLGRIEDGVRTLDGKLLRS
jgi:phenylacetate-coenzyme A ligase PaaK-like adenylate-forming protein